MILHARDDCAHIIKASRPYRSSDKRLSLSEVYACKALPTWVDLTSNQRQQLTLRGSNAQFVGGR